MQNETRKLITQEDRESITNTKRKRFVESVVVLDDCLFREFIEEKRSEDRYYDVVFKLSNQYHAKANRALLAINSNYFKRLLSGHYQEQELTIEVPFNDYILFEVMLNYLTTGFVVTSKEFEH